MLSALTSGLVTGWAIAVPIGAVGALLVMVAGCTPWRVGAAAALGVATVDGVYALLAVVAGSALSAVLAPVETPLRIGSGVVLVAVAGWVVVHGLRDRGAGWTAIAFPARRAYLRFVGLTAVNPTTVVYFAAVVLGNRHLTSTPAQSTVFVLAAFVASASWQLVLATGGRALGAVTTSPRARSVTGVVSGLVVAGLAVHTMTS